MHPEMKRELPESYLRRMTPMQARLVRDRLDRVDGDIGIRIEYAKLYHEGLTYPRYSRRDAEQNVASVRRHFERA
jgi:hypothetical protein